MRMEWLIGLGAALGILIAWSALTSRRSRPVPAGDDHRPTRKKRSYGRLRLRPDRVITKPPPEPVSIVTERPHTFPHRAAKMGTWFDLSTDGDPDRLRAAGLPVLATPDDIAAWLRIPVNRLAWLTHRCTRGRALSVKSTHYVYQWHKKRSGGLRLIESPKRDLRAVQQRILSEIFRPLPSSAAAHGFLPGRSILTNARPHVGKAVVVKFDLADFYGSIGPQKVIRLYRRLGYSREAALWLTRLTTSLAPFQASKPDVPWSQRRHLPQGAPTSPALANLVSYRLDQRLAGLARAFDLAYTRYADDLTFSGDETVNARLRLVIPLVQKIIRSEGFRHQRAKRQVLRSHQRQIVTGLVVNSATNVTRRDYDRLKAILHNCVKFGPTAQNREDCPNFAAHLLGRIAHVRQTHSGRGEKLLALYLRIRWDDART